MRIHRVWSFCAIVLAAISVVSCAEGQFGQAMQNMGKGMAQSMCGEGKGPASAAPEYCLYATDLQVLRDGVASVGISLVSRTGGRYVLRLNKASLSDNSGVSWRLIESSGLPYGTGLAPLLLDPSSEAQGSIKFKNDAGPSSGSVFTLEGDIFLYRADAQGQPVGNSAATRGFRLTGLRLQR